MINICTHNNYNYDFICRFLFILDSNAPEIEFAKSYYTNQLCKDLIINIYKKGGWGYYKRILYQDLKNNFKITDISVLEKISNNRYISTL